MGYSTPSAGDNWKTPGTNASWYAGNYYGSKNQTSSGSSGSSGFSYWNKKPKTGLRPYNSPRYVDGVLQTDTTLPTVSELSLNKAPVQTQPLPELNLEAWDPQKVTHESQMAASPVLRTARGLGAQFQSMLNRSQYNPAQASKMGREAFQGIGDTIASGVASAQQTGLERYLAQRAPEEKKAFTEYEAKVRRQDSDFAALMDEWRAMNEAKTVQWRTEEDRKEAGWEAAREDEKFRYQTDYERWLNPSNWRLA